MSGARGGGGSPGALLSRSATLLLAVAAAGALGIYLWASRRGFDLTDEGFYYAALSHPEALTAYPFSWDPGFGSLVFRWLGRSIPGMRVATLLVHASCAMLLGAGLLRYVAPWWRGLPRSPSRPDRLDADLRAQMALITALSCLPVYWMPAALTYNPVNGSALLAGTGLLLAALAGPGAPGPMRGWGLRGVGVAAALSTMAKFTSGPLLLAGALVVVAVAAGWTRRDRLRAALDLLAGYGLTWGLLFATVLPPRRAATLFVDGLGALRVLGGHDLRATLARYLGEAGSALLDVPRQQWPAAVLLLGAAGAAAWLPPGARRERARIAGALAALAAAFARVAWLAAREGQGLEARMASPYLGLLVVVGLGAVLARPASRGGTSARWDARSLERATVLAWVAALPVVGAGGTSNPLLLNVAFQSAPWWALGLLLAGSWSVALGTRAIQAVAVAGSAGLLLAQFVQGHVRAPYRLPQGLLQATAEVTMGPGGSRMLLDAASARHVREVQGGFAACGFRPGSDVLALFHLPGLVVAVDGVAPGYPWLPEGYPGSDPFIAGRLASLPRERLERAWVLEDDAPHARRVLAGQGLAFPDAYAPCGRVDSPYTGRAVRIWKPAPGGPPAAATPRDGR